MSAIKLIRQQEIRTIELHYYQLVLTESDLNKYYGNRI